MVLIAHTIMFEELCTLSIEQALYVYVNFELINVPNLVNFGRRDNFTQSWCYHLNCSAKLKPRSASYVE